MKDGYYAKKSIWKWILLYAIIGAIVYGLIYYFIFYKKESYGESYQYGSETEINEMKTNTAKYDEPGTYVNDAQGYQIDYVAGTELRETLDFNKYCVYLFYKGGYIGIASVKDDEAALNSGQAITSCAAIDGLGEGFVPTTQEIIINGKKIKAEGYKFQDQSNINYYYNIALAFSFNDNIIIQFGYANSDIKTSKESSDEEYANTMSVINQMLSTFKFTISVQQAISLVKNRQEVKNWLYLFNQPNGTSSIGGVPIIEIDHQDNKIYVVHVYELVRNEHVATFNWYEIDKEVGSVKPQFEK